MDLRSAIIHVGEKLVSEHNYSRKGFSKGGKSITELDNFLLWLHHHPEAREEFYNLGLDFIDTNSIIERNKKLWQM